MVRRCRVNSICFIEKEQIHALNLKRVHAKFNAICSNPWRWSGNHGKLQGLLLFMDAVTRRAPRLLINILGTLVGVLTILLAAFAWRLAQGPIELGQVTPYVEAALNDQDLGFTVEIGEAELTWGDWQEAFEIRILDLGVFDNAGALLLSTHEVVLDMSLPSLIRGELRPRSIVLVKPRVTVVRQEDGAVTFALMAPFESEPEEQSLGRVAVDPAALTRNELIKAMLEAGTAPPFDYLREVQIVGADLRVDDRVLGLSWNAPAATFVVSRSKSGLAASAQMTLRAEDYMLDLDMESTLDSGSGQAMVSVGVSDFEMQDLPDLVPILPRFDGLDVHVDGELDLVFDRNLHLERSSFLIEAAGGRVDMPAVFDAPFSFGPSHSAGFLRPGLSGIEIVELDLDLGLEQTSGQIVIEGFAPDSLIDVRLDIAGLPLDDLGKFWPNKLMPRARAWLTDRLSDGRIEQASVAFKATIDDLARDHLPLENLIISLDATGATVEYLQGMPVVRDIDGHVAIIDDSMRIDAVGGHIGNLTSERSVLSMERLNGSKGMLVGVEMRGPAREVLELASREPYALTGKVGLDPELVSGSFSGRLELVVPRLVDLVPADVLYRIAVDVIDVELTTGFRGFEVDGANGLLILDPGTARLDGNFRLNGVPFVASYFHDFAPDAGVIRTVNLQGSVGEEERAALGLVDPIDMKGAVDIVLDMSQASDLTMTWNAVADLTSTDIVFPLLEIDKRPGEPGRASLRLVDDGGMFLIAEEATLGVGATLVEAGGVVRASDVSLVRLDLQRLAFGRNDLSGALSVREDGFYEIALGGGVIDLQPMMDDVAASSGPELPSFRLKGLIDRVWITDDDAVHEVYIDGLYTGAIWESLAISGQIDDETPMSVNIWRFSETERRFEYNAADVGDAIRLFGLFDHAEGGPLQVRARIDDSDPDRPAVGAIRVEGFVLRQAPILTRLLSIASLEAIVNALSGDGLEFSGALMPFEKRGDIVTLTDARAFGPGLGITLGGEVDLGNNVLDLHGTFVPAYIVNSVLGEIPLIGDILTGTEVGGGIFAFAFDVQGPRDAPEVNVDALSVLAPGILRSIFTAPTDDEVETIIGESSKPDGGR